MIGWILFMLLDLMLLMTVFGWQDIKQWLTKKDEYAYGKPKDVSDLEIKPGDEIFVFSTKKA